MDKKIYIVCDLSSVSGLLWGGCGLPAWYGLPSLQDDKLRRQMTLFVNEAAEVALEYGVGEILVHETCPLDLETLHPEAKIIRGAKTLYIDETFAGLCFVGQGLTSNISLPDGFRNNLRAVKFNGIEVDEMVITALYAGSFGVPVLLAHGKKRAFKNLKRFVPGLRISSTVGVAMRAGMKHPNNLKTAVLRGKVKVEFEFDRPVFADMHCRFPRVRRVSERVTAVSANDIRSAFAAYCAVGLVAAVDWVK